MSAVAALRARESHRGCQGKQREREPELEPEPERGGERERDGERRRVPEGAREAFNQC